LLYQYSTSGSDRYPTTAYSLHEFFTNSSHYRYSTSDLLKTSNLISGKPAEERKPEPRRIFLSYSDKPQNEYLVENLVDRFLTLLGYETHYLKKNYDTRVGSHELRVEQLIRNCGVLIAFFTNDDPIDDRYETRRNVADEVGIAKGQGLTVICFYEEQNKVHTNAWPYTVPKPFNTSRPAELLLEILVALKNTAAFPLK